MCAPSVRPASPFFFIYIAWMAAVACIKSTFFYLIAFRSSADSYGGYDQASTTTSVQHRRRNRADSQEHNHGHNATTTARDPHQSHACGNTNTPPAGAKSPSSRPPPGSIVHNSQPPRYGIAALIMCVEGFLDQLTGTKMRYNRGISYLASQNCATVTGFLVYSGPGTEKLCLSGESFFVLHHAPDM